MLKGEKPKAPTRGDCISNAARRHSDSLGMKRLAAMPTVTARGLWVSAPACSIQPPMKAKPCMPSANTPLVRVEKVVPNMNVILSNRTHSSQMRLMPRSRW